MTTQTRDEYTEDEMCAIVGSREFVVNCSFGGFGVSTAANLYIGDHTKRRIWDWQDDAGRTDSRLHAAIRELGTDVNGEYANLVIMRIPNAVNAVIEEYDGNETLRGSVPWREIAMDMHDPLDNGAVRTPLTDMIRSSVIDISRLPDTFESDDVYAPANMPSKKTHVDVKEHELLARARSNVRDLLKFHYTSDEPSHTASHRLLSLAKGYVSSLQGDIVCAIRDELSKDRGELYRKWQVHDELRVFALAVLDRATIVHKHKTRASTSVLGQYTFENDLGLSITVMLIDRADATTRSLQTDLSPRPIKRLRVDGEHTNTDE